MTVGSKANGEGTSATARGLASVVAMPQRDEDQPQYSYWVRKRLAQELTDAGLTEEPPRVQAS